MSKVQASKRKRALFKKFRHINLSTNCTMCGKKTGYVHHYLCNDCHRKKQREKIKKLGGVKL